MSWFFFALITVLAWGGADLFYKRGADCKEKYSHLKTSVMVGIVMGLHAVYTLIFGGIDYDFRNILIYLPVSLMYILSMTVGYFGLRYLELSISSPVQNTSGGIVCVLCLIFLSESLNAPQIVAVLAMCIGVVMLGIFENKSAKLDATPADKKYIKGWKAFLIPIGYCIIDALGTFFDAYYLDDFEKTPLVGVTEENFEDVANTSYELTFLIAAIILLIYICVIKKEKFSIKAQGNRTAAAVFETAGQFTYVYAMAANAAIAAPMVASYSIVSMILSRIFLKEKLTGKQYVAIALVIIGIAIVGYFDEMG